jgi:CRP/FNR family transcriptional regulator, cyclic AMP receptor protein
MNSFEPIDLSQIYIFSELNSVEINQIASTCRQEVYQAGDKIIDQMSATREVYFIAEGAVSVTNLTTSGKEVTLEILDKNKCFGELAAIDGGKRSSSVTVTETSLIASMSASDFQKTLKEHSSVALKVMVMMAKIIRTSCERITELVTLGANARVLAELMKRIHEQRANKDTNEILVENFPTHNEIARRASTTRETVTRVLSALAKKNIILRQGTSLKVYDIRVLERTFFNLSDSDI